MCDRKKKILSLFALLIFSISITQLIGVAAEQNAGIVQSSRVPVIISFVSEASENDKIKAVASVEGEVKHKYSIINGMAVMVPTARMQELQKNPLVLSVDQDIKVKAFGIDADEQIRAEQFWIAGDTGQGIPVAILDTGIDNSHPEFSGRISKCHSEITNTDICNDQHYHGTHVAGIAGAAGNLGTSNSATAKGVAPNISFYIDQVLDANGDGTLSDIIAGIDWATANGAKVISMSLGTAPVVTTEPNCDHQRYGLTSLKNAINNAVTQGVTVVAAAGNDWPNEGVGAPACISSTIAVGSVGSTDTIAGDSSRGGPMADHGIVAPGVNIFSTWPGGGYRTLSGTSMATPVVSGIIALMIKANSSLSPTSPTDQPIRSILFNTACNQNTNPSCPTGTVPNTVYGYGRVDALRAYNSVIRFINGTVIDSLNKTGIAGVMVSTNTSLSTTTDATGFYSFAVTDGSYNLTATYDIRYYTNITTVSTIGQAVVWQEIELIKKPTGSITGNVTKCCT